MLEKFKLGTRENDNDYIYLINHSPMYLSKTEELFKKHLGEESLESYEEGGFFGGFTNAFKYKKEKHDEFMTKIFPLLVEDSEGYYVQRETMSEANEI